MSGRRDLSTRLVSDILNRIEGVLSHIILLKEMRFKLPGCVSYETSVHGLTRNEIYKILANVFEGQGCVVSLDEFGGDPEKGIEPAIEGMYIVCKNNAVYLHVELGKNILDINAWSRGLIKK